MTQSINSLHKILKDQTRRKIIATLQEEGALGYTELMERLEIVRTGTFNYHLKVLGDLLGKDNSGRYVLSEKGRVAYKVLSEFPNGPPLEQAYKWKRVIASILALANGISLIVSTLLFFVGYIDWHFFSSQIIYSLVAFFVALIIFKFPTTRPKYDPKRAKKTNLFVLYFRGRNVHFNLSILCAGSFVNLYFGEANTGRSSWERFLAVFLYWRSNDRWNNWLYII